MTTDLTVTEKAALAARVREVVQRAADTHERRLDAYTRGLAAIAAVVEATPEGVTVDEHLENLQQAGDIGALSEYERLLGASGDAFAALETAEDAATDAGRAVASLIAEVLPQGVAPAGHDAKSNLR